MPALCWRGTARMRHILAEVLGRRYIMRTLFLLFLIRKIIKNREKCDIRYGHFFK